MTVGKMKLRIGLMTLLWLMCSCLIHQSISVGCRLEVYVNQHMLSGHLHCPMCNVSLVINDDNNCGLREYFETAANCTGPRCNSTCDLCSASDETPTTPGIEGQMNVSPASPPSTCTNKTNNGNGDTECKTSEILHALCTPATVTVCPTRTPGKKINNLTPFIQRSTTTVTTTEHKMTTVTAECPKQFPFITRHKLYSSFTKTETSTVYATVVVSQLCASPTVKNSMVKTPITSALGGVVGLLVVLIAVLASGYMFLYLHMKKRGALKFTSVQQMFPNTQSTTSSLHHNITLRRYDNPIYEETTQEELIPIGATSVRSHLQEVGPTYEAIPPSAVSNVIVLNNNDKINGESSTTKDKQLQACKRMSAKVTSQEKLNVDETNSLVGLAENDIENNYHLLGKEEQEKTQNTESNQDEVDNNDGNYYLLSGVEDEEEVKGNNTGTRDNEDDDNHYYLLRNGEEEEVREEAVYHELERPGDADNDYEDPDDGNLFINSVQGRAEEPFNLNDRPLAYEVPHFSFSKN